MNGARPGGSIQQASSRSPDCDLGTCLDSEFGKDVLEVRRYCSRGYQQRLGDLLVGQPARHQDCHLTLALGQGGRCRLRRHARARVRRVCTRQRILHRAIQPETAADRLLSCKRLWVQLLLDALQKAFVLLALSGWKRGAGDLAKGVCRSEESRRTPSLSSGRRGRGNTSRLG